MKKKKSSKLQSFDDDEELHISSPTLLSTTSRLSPMASPSLSRNLSWRGMLPPEINLHPSFPSMSPEGSAPSTPTTPTETAFLSKVASLRSSTPIFYSQSAARRKPPPFEKKLECSLEELCLGCVKQIKITRDAISSTGLIVQEEEIIMIQVKPRWRNGTKITVEGKGDERPGSLPADIIFVVEEKKHPILKRNGDDLELGVEIPLVQALTGCEISIPLLGGGKTTLSLDDIIHPGFEMIIHGQGMPNSLEEGQRGDLRLNFLVKFPSELSDEQRSEVASILEEC